MSFNSKECSLGCGKMDFLWTATILGKHEVQYFQCPQCNLIQTEKPFWLEEAYASAITSMDTGLAGRNIENRSRLESVLHCLFNDAESIIDIGGGYGMLTRLMRDIGFPFLTYDIYCENLFAKNFEATDKTEADCLTAFEVFEHIEDPRSFLEDTFRKHKCRSIIFSTLSFDTNQAPNKDWWYYTFPTGQHIAFYHENTLQLLASQFGCKYYKLAKDFHLISDRPVSFTDHLFLSHKKAAKLYRRWVSSKRKGLSFTLQDAGLKEE